MVLNGLSRPYVLSSLERRRNKDWNKFLTIKARTADRNKQKE